MSPGERRILRQLLAHRLNGPWARLRGPLGPLVGALLRERLAGLTRGRLRAWTAAALRGDGACGCFCLMLHDLISGVTRVANRTLNPPTVEIRSGERKTMA